MNTVAPIDVFDAVIDQREVISQLIASSKNPVHGYLFVGPKGSCRWEAAKAFAAIILSSTETEEISQRSMKLALQGSHPDLVMIEPTGNQYRDEEVQRLINESSRSPIESERKIIVASRFHTANETAVGRLLKTLEEPPESTIIILISENIPENQITIASRCQKVQFQPITIEAMQIWLEGHGLDSEKGELIALASSGDLDRARDLMSDSGVLDRYRIWSTIPDRLAPTGHVIATVVEEIQSAIDKAQEATTQRHLQEMEELSEREEQFGIRGSGRNELEAKQKREIRRFRTDELYFGFSVLTNHFRDELVEAPKVGGIEVIKKIHSAKVALARNPNEKLLLQSLLISLSE